ncbi:hypothetical protein JXA84_03710 [candidate division WOR-3 bacterium]|nr:hypothetical protein [candidate division WOR-3 bacterium]
MDVFKLIIAIDISVVSLALAVVIFRLFFLIRKTEGVLEEARKTVYLANVEIPRIIAELQGAIAELKNISHEAKNILQGVSHSISQSMQRIPQKSSSMNLAGYAATNLIPQIGRIRNFLTIAIFMYRTFSTIRKFFGFLKNRRKRR